MNRIIAIRTALLGAFALALSACGINSVPEKEEVVNARWADVQSAYQRRADLVPNLVSTVRAAAGSEEAILTQVIEARAQATSTTINTGDLGDAEKFRQFEQAQGNLGSALSRLMVVVERYPELQSQQRFADLMVALEGTENRIDASRTRYNEAVRVYNTAIRTFPETIGANIIHGAEPKETFQADAAAQTAPTVDFGDMDPGASGN
ncbi:LemA family protein [Qipengyuania sp. 1NDW9]|uniref:LemA family protein n=1 Tax=Qipengyuania xiapuensis TaxID=2867236 RepID=UPI001C870637|nr:LemA family protein [Qipengyuania xiapuensis]MBX7493629.1 LemA family protein [Qipengyuania xiapuensis]